MQTKTDTDMTTKDFFCEIFNINSDFIDKICDDFDVDFDDEQVYEILDLCSGGFEQRAYGRVGNLLIKRIFETVIDDYSDRLDENKFAINADGYCSTLEYDGKIIHNTAELNAIADATEDEEEPLIITDYEDYAVDAVGSKYDTLNGFQLGEVVYDQLGEIGIILAFYDGNEVRLDSNGVTDIDNIRKCPADIAAEAISHKQKIRRKEPK